MTNLLDQESVSQNDIQMILGIDRAAISRHLQILEDKKYIVREKNPLDNRGVIVSLTQSGRDVMVNCNDEHDVIVKKLLNEINHQQLLELSTTLKKLKENVKSMLEKSEKV